MKGFLGVSDFLEEVSSLSHSCFPLSLHWWLRKALISLLAILWSSAFKWIYLSPLLFTSLLFSAICRPPQTTILPFSFFFPLGMVLITPSCTMSRTSIHISSGTLSIRSNPLNPFSKNTGVGCHSLLQGIFLTQGSNPGFLHCRKILYHMSHQGSLEAACCCCY